MVGVTTDTNVKEVLTALQLFRSCSVLSCQLALVVVTGYFESRGGCLLLSSCHGAFGSHVLLPA